MNSGMPTKDFGFDAFFEKATRNKPYPFQRRLATCEHLPELIDIPTGLGKTDAVVLAWLWRGRFASQEVRDATPRRLVYCLPMRVLAEQMEKTAREWLRNLCIFSEHPGDSDGTAVTVLMNDEDKDDWTFYPERDAILVRTQGMLPLRTLNRGCGLNQYRRPVYLRLSNLGFYRRHLCAARY